MRVCKPESLRVYKLVGLQVHEFVVEELVTLLVNKLVSQGVYKVVSLQAHEFIG